APVVQQRVQPGHELEHGLGNDGEPAVVDHEFQAGGQLAHRLLILRADPQVGVDAGRLTRGDAAGTHQAANRIQVVADAQGFVVTLHAFLGYPGSGEVVLHHADPAIVGVAHIVGTPLVQVGEVDLLVLVFRRV